MVTHSWLFVVVLVLAVLALVRAGFKREDKGRQSAVHKNRGEKL
jgi:hypothetical protein